MTRQYAESQGSQSAGTGSAIAQSAVGKQTLVEQAAAHAPTQCTAYPGITPMQRVQSAIATADLPALIALQHELLQQMRSDPLHPPEEARAGLATARRWEMDRIVAIRDSYQAQLTAASGSASASAPGGGTDATAAVEALEVQMDAQCTPYLDALLEGDPQYRYLHPDPDVVAKVFSAVRLHAARRGVAQIGHRADAEAEARAHGRVPTEAWCGAFAFTQAEQAGGFDRHWVGNMQGEGGIRSALAYHGTANTWIWAFDHWENLRLYHQQRGSERWYEAIHQAPPSHGIQAGDLVLIDNNFGTDPDHITTAISFDGRFLTTVGGNQGDGEQGVSRSGHAWDLTANPEPNDVRAIEGGHRVRRVDAHAGPKHKRVHGIGRWSVVDYERHLYATSRDRPTAPPTAHQLAQIGR